MTCDGPSYIDRFLPLRGKSNDTPVCEVDTAFITALQADENAQDGQIFLDTDTAVFYIGLPDGTIALIGGAPVANAELCDGDGDTCFITDTDGADSDVASIQVAANPVVRIEDPTDTDETRFLVGNAVPQLNGAWQFEGLGGYAVNATWRSEFGIGQRAGSTSQYASLGVLASDFSRFAFNRAYYSGSIDTVVAAVEVIGGGNVHTHQVEETQSYTIARSGGRESIVRTTSSAITLEFGGAASATPHYTFDNVDGQLNTHTSVKSFADDAAAGVGGLVAGDMYQTDGAGAAPLNVAGIVMIKQ